MGFWDDLGEKAGKAANRKVQDLDKKKERIERLSEKYERYTVEELKNIVKNGSSDEKMAAKLALRNQGYNV